MRQIHGIQTESEPSVVSFCVAFILGAGEGKMAFGLHSVRKYHQR